MLNTHIKLMAKIGDNLNGSEYDNKKKTYQILHQIFGTTFLGEGLNERTNFLTKYLSAVGKLEGDNVVSSTFSDDYQPPYYLFLSNLTCFFDGSEKVFEITIPKGYKVTEKEASLKDFHYVGKDVLKGFKKFLEKVMPDLELHFEATDKVVERTFLAEIKQNILLTNVEYLNYIDFTSRLTKPKETAEELTLELQDFYSGICEVVDNPRYISLECELYSCDCPVCLSYAKDGDVMFDIDFKLANENESITLNED